MFFCVALLLPLIDFLCVCVICIFFFLFFSAQVDECEIKVIKETFKDLCHLNGGSTRIDKETFLQYLPLPGLLGGE